MSSGWMYILQCADGSYYTGSTTNLELRLAQHQAGEGANHTEKRLPVKLVYYEYFDRIQDAFYREKQVQGWSRKKKEALIKGDYELLKRLSRSSPVASAGSATGKSASSATGEKKLLPEPVEGSSKPAEGSGNIPVASTGTIPVASTGSATGETKSSATGEKNPLPEPAEGSGSTIPVASINSATGRRRKKPLPEPFPEPVEGNGSGKGNGSSNNKNPKSP